MVKEIYWFTIRHRLVARGLDHVDAFGRNVAIERETCSFLIELLLQSEHNAFQCTALSNPLRSGFNRVNDLKSTFSQLPKPFRHTPTATAEFGIASSGQGLFS